MRLIDADALRGIPIDIDHIGEMTVGAVEAEQGQEHIHGGTC